MRTTILFSLLLLVSLLTHAQSFTIVDPVVDRNTVVTEGGYEVLNAGLINNTDSPDTIFFNLVSSTNPEEWRFSLCGPQNCYVPGPSSDSGKDVLKVSDKAQLFEVNWSPFTQDQGELVYEVYSYKSPSDKKRVTFKMTASVLSAKVESISNFTSVYPNPCNDIIIVETPDDSYTEASISDISGKVVLQQKLNALNNTLNVSSLDKGMYVLTSKGSQLLRKTIFIY